MNIPMDKIFMTMVILLAFPAMGVAAPAAPGSGDALQAIVDRSLIRELMDRYGVVHDSGSAEEYADLFTDDGEIAVAPGGAAVVKGRRALMDQARRDHERFSVTGTDGRSTSLMRHLISNSQITLTGRDTATGTCYVTTVVKKEDVGPAILSISRYTDRYARSDGRWLIQRREITLEFGNSALASQLGFGR